MNKIEEIENLIGNIESALDSYKYNKYENLAIKEETKQEIFNECEYFFKTIKEKAEELDDTIDEIIESENEMSNYEFDCREDDRRRYQNVIGG